MTCRPGEVEWAPSNVGGTPGYLAPEILQGSLWYQECQKAGHMIRAPEAPFSEKSDVWSMGVVMAELVMDHFVVNSVRY
jgi:serine/threonine protein kinase